MTERLIANGHLYSTVMSYSINQLIAFSDLLTQRLVIEGKNDASLTRFAVWGDSKEFQKWVSRNG